MHLWAIPRGVAGQSWSVRGKGGEGRRRGVMLVQFRAQTVMTKCVGFAIILCEVRVWTVQSVGGWCLESQKQYEGSTTSMLHAFRSRFVFKTAPIAILESHIGPKPACQHAKQCSRTMHNLCIASEPLLATMSDLDESS